MPDIYRYAYIRISHRIHYRADQKYSSFGEHYFTDAGEKFDVMAIARVDTTTQHKKIPQHLLAPKKNGTRPRLFLRPSQQEQPEL